METKFEKATASEKLADFFHSYRKVLAAVLVVAAVFVVVYGVFAAVTTESAKKGLADIDSITYVMTKDSASLSDAELEARRNTALSQLAVYNNKGGIVGVRANMLTAEIKNIQKKYDEAADMWTKAAAKGKNSYTAPLAYFNAATAYEELNNLDKAADFYKKAADVKDFDQAAHAKFSLGRVLETKGDKAGAMTVYSELCDKNPDDSWAKLAKSRLVSFEVTE